VVENHLSFNFRQEVEVSQSLVNCEISERQLQIKKSIAESFNKMGVLKIP